MASLYPGGYDSFTQPGEFLDDPAHDQLHIELSDAVEAVQTELGLNPRGSFASVRARLDAHDRAGCTLRRLASLSLTGGGAETTITWDTEDADTSTFYPGSGSVITVPAGMAGIYGLTCRIVTASAAVAGSSIRIQMSGNAYLFDRSTSSTVFTSTLISPMSPGGQVTVSFLNAGTTVNLSSAIIYFYRVSI